MNWGSFIQPVMSHFRLGRLAKFATAFPDIGIISEEDIIF
jgi:hypothetical protein